MAKEEEDEVACPVCGKVVGLDVTSCPHCGAEFEEEEVAEEVAVAISSDEDEDIACPVCGHVVGLDLSACPKCGAEFEEEEIEEVIEVEEKQVYVPVAAPKPAPPKTKAKARAAEKPKERPRKAPPKARPKERAPVSEGMTASIMDFRVIGIALILLGILGTQVALMIDWYWSWVPPIEDNMGLFVALPVVILIVGLLVFMLVKKAVSGGREMPSMMPGVSLALFLFGILALIVIVLWDPINSALRDSSGAVAGGFALALVLGIFLLMMGMRTAAEKAAC